MMSSSTPTSITVPSPADFHVHLRQAPLSALIAPHVPLGGMDLGYVMPNTIPPISTSDAAVQYISELKSLLGPDGAHVELYGTLYLNPSLTPDEIRKAAATGVVKGVKSYPRGVTTNSDGGIESYDNYYPVFEAMQETGLVLNLHGEVPSDADKNISVLNAEAMFLSHLAKIHSAFPRLRIVLEHATTAAAVEAVKACGDTVGCTITPHHLVLTVDDWAGRPIHFCKPVAKEPRDRAALQAVIREGHPRFFLGSDSAPHPIGKKLPQLSEHGHSAASQLCAAGIYTSSILLPLCATILESFGALERLEGYVSTHGRAFYGIKGKEGRSVRLERTKMTVDAAHVLPEAQAQGSEIAVVPFWAGKELTWRIAKE